MIQQRYVSMDTVMLKTWHHLLSDFASTEKSETSMTSIKDAFKCKPTIEGVRSVCDSYVPKYGQPSWHFARCHQLKHFLKRYTFADDLYTQQDLVNNTTELFKQTQVRIASLEAKPPTERVHRVLQEARRILKDALGSYDVEEHMSSCKFSNRSTVGSSLQRGSIDHKLSDPLSGSTWQVKWFNNYLATDSFLKAAINPKREICSALNLTLVPKTYKILRSIMPNTTIGSFYSYGLGKVLSSRLKNVGIDLRYQQDIHRRIIKKFSVTCSHVTADLSSASDSFSTWLINALVPREWFIALKSGRINQCLINGRKSYMASFMAMGIGFTFPLQTILFWALLKAIQNFTGFTGRISVFGDDLIYPRRMHYYVCEIFRELGFVINIDKTFVNEIFRESCGSDYYYGYDVRPHLPEGDGCVGHTNVKFCMEVYKLLNGLLRRWDRVEIPITWNYLIGILSNGPHGLLVVPPDMPDHSGLKVLGDTNDFPWFYPVSPCVFIKDTYSTGFKFYSLTRALRPVVKVQLFLWDLLRSKSQMEDVSACYASERDILRWKHDRYRWVRLHDGSRVKKLRPFVASKSGGVQWNLVSGSTQIQGTYNT